MLENLHSILTLDNVCKLFLGFVVYSVIGWFFETLLHIIRDKKVVKRGFLFGPLCPIYGVGATIQILILDGRTDNVFLLFLGGFLISGLLEYITHFVLEKCFHAMWWDYSTRRFNIKGRVYLNGLLFMGVGSAILLKFVHPFLAGIRDSIPPRGLHIICFVLYSIFLLDISTTVADLKNSVGALKHILNVAIEESQNFIDSTEETVNEVTENIKNNEKVVELIKKLNDEKSPITKFRKRFSNVNIQKYKDILDVIRDKPDESKARTDIKLYGEKNDFEDEENAEIKEQK